MQSEASIVYKKFMNSAYCASTEPRNAEFTDNGGTSSKDAVRPDIESFFALSSKILLKHKLCILKLTPFAVTSKHSAFNCTKYGTIYPFIINNEFIVPFYCVFILFFSSDSLLCKAIRQ